MKTKEREGFEALFEIAKNNIARARHIARMIPVEKLSLKILMMYRESKDFNETCLAEELALLILADNLSYSKLIDYQKSSNSRVSELASRLLINHFGERLTISTLFELQKSKIQTTREDAKHFALQISKDKLSLEFLLKIMSSTSGDTYNLAKELAMVIDIERLEPKMLIESQRIDSLQVRQFVHTLALKIGSSKYDYSDLLRRQSAIYPAERYLCKDILMIMPKSCFEYLTLKTFVGSDCSGTNDMALYLLMKHFSETFDEDDLKLIELSPNLELNLRAKELLFDIELKDPEAAMQSEDFIKGYFS